MIITGSELIAEFVSRDASALKSMNRWVKAVVVANWRSPLEVIRTFRHADPLVRVASGRRVAVFNVRGNHYRLVASIDYGLKAVRVLRVMTHAESSRDRWKDSL